MLRLRAPIAVLCTSVFVGACAGRAAAPGAAQPPAPDPAAAGVAPPPLTSAGPAPGIDPSDRRSGERQTRRAIFEGAWTLVRDKHFDKTLGGLDWNAMREKYEPLALAAPDAATFYRFLNQMLGELGQSHLEVAGPGSPPSPAFDPETPPSAGGEADPG
jgi:hypothetical protein